MIKNFDKAAIVMPHRTVSYSQFFANTDLMAARTPHTRGAHTVIFAENREGWVYAFFAVWQNKGVAVPVDASMSVDELAYIIGDCKPEAVWTSRARKATVEQAVEQVGASVRVLVMEDFVEQEPAPLLSWQGGDNFKEMEEECAVVIYTSGTTGKPKGVMLSYKNLMANLHAVSNEVPICNEERRALILLPLHHILPLMGTLVIPMVAGGGVAICPTMQAADIMGTLQLGEVGIFIGVPRLWQTLYSGIKKKIDASAVTRALFKLCEKVGSTKFSRIVFKAVHQKLGGHLDFCVSGGAALDKEIAEGLRTLGLDVLEGYGMSECAPMISFTRPDDIVPGSVGKPLTICRTMLADDGELLVKGNNVMMGYLGKPEATAETIDAEGWLHTGDLGRFDDEGRLYITGRSKELIILSNGKNVQPAEIEYKLEKYDEMVEEVAVIADGDQLAAIFVPKKGWADTLSDTAAADTLKRLVLEPYNLQAQGYKKVKTAYVSREPLPRTKLDKIQRFKLRDIITKQAEAADKPAQEKAEVDAALPEELRIVMNYIEGEKQQPVTPAMHLETDLGFDSLDMVGLQSFIEQTFGVSIAADQLPAFRSLEELAQRITATRTRMEVEHQDWQTLLNAPQAEQQELPRGGLGHRLWARSFAAFFKVYNRLTIKGVERLPKDGPFILAANHQSYMDGAIVMAGVPWKQIDACYFYATEEHVQGRVLRHLAREHNVILMERRNLKNSILKLGQVLKQGKCIVIFPEGSRTHTGRLGNFKKTFAILAKELNVPIVPVRLSGAYDAMPRGTHYFKPSHITVEYLEPIAPDSAIAYEDLAEKVKAAIAQPQ